MRPNATHLQEGIETSFWGRFASKELHRTEHSIVVPSIRIVKRLNISENCVAISND